MRHYAAHDHFIAPARAYPQVWRLIVGIVLAFVVYVGAILVYTQATRALDPLLASMDTYWGAAVTMYVLLFSFVFMAFAAGVSARLMHSRGFASLLGPRHAVLRDFAIVASAVVALMIVVFALPPWDMGGEFVRAKPLGIWVLLLVPSLLLVLVQVSAEEIFFRGYLQQQLAARFDTPLIWMLLPSMLFAAGHYMPTIAGNNALLIVIWSGIFGLFMADLTARSGSLGPAIAVHFCNNVVAIVLIAPPDDMYGLALYLSPISMADEAALRAWLPAEFAMMLVTWLVARLAIRR